jgi:hypothetical protein
VERELEQLRQQLQIRLQRLDAPKPDRLYIASLDQGDGLVGDLDGGRYVVVAASAGRWSLKSAVLGSRDLSRLPIDIRDDDVGGVVVTLTDRPTRIEGVVTTRQGRNETNAKVLLFPVDSSAWSDDMRSRPRDFLATQATSAGAYVLSGMPAGDYFLVAVTQGASGLEEVTRAGPVRDWLNPLFLSAVAKRATRVRIGNGEVQRHDLTLVLVK